MSRVSVSPKAFLDMYTTMAIVHPVTGQSFNVNITQYGAGWEDSEKSGEGRKGSRYYNEYNNFFVPALRMAYHGRNSPIGSGPFFMDAVKYPKLTAKDIFTVGGLIRAFLGKGSPENMRDALRLALAAGRIGAGKDAMGRNPAYATPQQYADDFISLDCNGFALNYYRLDPDMKIEYLVKAAKPRQRVSDVKVGDAVVTIPKPGHFEHIALIAEWNNDSGAVDTGNVYIRMAEWGAAGDESKHYTNSTQHEVSRNSGEYGVYFTTDGSKKRYIFDISA